ncbi:GNAT family N-acetyltransferase [Sinisalibacter aestuarii]|uniref:N-acetyltransferase n=1 Tax=Sinisalibacter aestuarii TaxID=2949426 RepID=A0ABQ5LRP6_9RHOB|nr:GNAT family N-acetyltransferase [Sinisalibacter aestuarii]GKY86752.1 N-acetyltransferase [Sinisalibacter aestuarii]
MLRPARAGDEAAMETFLAAHAETSMFLRGNLHNFGLFERNDPHGTEYWIAETGGEIAAIFGISNGGFAMSQAPGAPDSLWDAFAGCLRGRELAGLSGEEAQVAQSKRALGIGRAALSLDDPEPLFRLSLDRLRLPDGTGGIRRPIEADRALLERWNAAYVTELRMGTPGRVATESRERAERAIKGDDTRLLISDGTPVAMTALNARLPDMVQIGGVYTPPDLRGRGHARRAVALHMDELRGDGVTTAILFASGPAACRAYEAIGFERIGTYALVFLKEPVVIG